MSLIIFIKMISLCRRWLGWTWRRRWSVSSPWWKGWRVMAGTQTRRRGRRRWGRVWPSCRRLWTWCLPRSPSSSPSSPWWSVLCVCLPRPHLPHHDGQCCVSVSLVLTFLTMMVSACVSVSLFLTMTVSAVCLSPSSSPWWSVRVCLSPSSSPW